MFFLLVFVNVQSKLLTWMDEYGFVKYVFNDIRVSTFHYYLIYFSISFCVQMFSSILMILTFYLKFVHKPGITYAEKGLYMDALNAYLKSNEINPNHEKTIFNLGNLVIMIFQRL